MHEDRGSFMLEATGTLKHDALSKLVLLNLFSESPIVLMSCWDSARPPPLVGTKSQFFPYFFVKAPLKHFHHRILRGHPYIT